MPEPHIPVAIREAAAEIQWNLDSGAPDSPLGDATPWHQAAPGLRDEYLDDAYAVLKIVDGPIRADERRRVLVELAEEFAGRAGSNAASATEAATYRTAARLCRHKAEEPIDG